MNDQFDKISNDLQDINYLFRGKNLLLVSKSANKEIGVVNSDQFKNCTDLFNSYFPNLKKPIGEDSSINKSTYIKTRLIVKKKSFYIFNSVY